MKRTYLISILFIIILGVILLPVFMSPKTNKQLGKKPSKELPKEVIITLNPNGFSPKQVEIKVGSAVRWKNVSGDKQTVNSNDYPTNQLHKELNFGIFNNGSSVVYTFTKPGNYGYHNQFHPEQKGEVVVTK